jgi:HPt (histidine-containing phosphotransfer) domain-containing protein
MDELTVKVSPDVADLIPAFMANRQAEIAHFQRLLEARDFDEMAKIAHRMIGVGTPYGFPYITGTARVIREAAQARDLEGLRELVKALADYLARVKIVVED